MTLSSSPINAAIAAFLSSYADDGAEHVSAIVAAAKQAAAEKKGMQASLFSGFLQLAEQGCDPAAVRASGAAVRKAVTRIMRAQAGFPADKKKGSKESGAPDFSTASVYAGIVADCLAASRDNRNAWDAAFLAVKDATETPPAEHACGLFEAVNANKRALAKYAELCAAEMEQRYPALSHQDPSAVGARTVEELERENASLRSWQAEHLQSGSGDAAAMLAIARKERDAANESAIAAQEVARRQAAELEELRAIAMEAARVLGKDSTADVLAELRATERAE